MEGVLCYALLQFPLSLPLMIRFPFSRPSFSRHIPDNDLACVLVQASRVEAKSFPSLQLALVDPDSSLGSGGRHQLLGLRSISRHDPMEFTGCVHTLEFSVIFAVRFRRLLLVSFVLCLAFLGATNIPLSFCNWSLLFEGTGHRIGVVLVP